MAVKSLHILNVGIDTEVDKGFITFGVDRGKMMETIFLVFLIRTDHRNILVDTVPHPDDIQTWNSMGSKMILQPEDQLTQRLKEIGLSMNDIDLVVTTHLHWNHVGWLTHLHNAEVIVQRDEYNFALNTPPYASAFYFPKRYNSSQIKWRIVDGDSILMPGLTLLFTPGHTVGHQSIMVDLPKSGPLLLCGDAGFVQENFEKELIPMFFGNPKQALFSIKRLNVWAHVRKAQILPSHDIAYWRKNTIKSPEAYI